MEIIQIVSIAIGAFLLIIMLLVGVLLFAQSKLVKQGNIKIVVNGEEENAIQTPAGGSLLTSLSGSKLFLPSACGGGGTCAMCKCQVLEGGGDVLPTEVGHLSRQEQLSQVRLACQVKVREDMKIQIPEEVFGIKKWECEVVSNYNLATFIKEFVVKLPPGEALDFQPGGYIQIDVPECEIDFKTMDISPNPTEGKAPDEFQAEWDQYGLWNLKMKNDEPLFRAYSMGNHPAEGNIILLKIRIATPPWDRKNNTWLDVNPGVCSSYIFSRKPGDKVTISGPYGEFFIKDTNKEMIYVGGGAGMAPLRSHIFHLFQTLKSGRKVSYWYGGRSKRELFYTQQFREIEKAFPNFSYHIALSEPKEEDSWDGHKGFIHNVLIDNYLSKHEDPEEIEFYFCGPPMMNQAVMNMCDTFGIPEEHIAFDDFGG